MAKDVHKDFKYRKIKKPNKFIVFVAKFIMGLICKKRNVEFIYDDGYNSTLNKPVVLLACHASKDDYIYVFKGAKRSDLHIICGYQNIFKKGIYFLLKNLGVIAKYLYQPDITATRQIFEAVKLGDSVAIFPEGIQSTSGSTHPINPATIGLLRKLKLPVVLATSKGSYLTRTRYSTDVKKGKIIMNYSLLFTPEELASSTEEQLNKKLLSRFKYNDYEFNRQNKIAYVGKKPNVYGLDNIIFKCPHCFSEYKFVVNGSNMVCKECGFEVTMNEYYEMSAVNKELKFIDVDAWYKWQRNVIRKEVKSDDFKMSTTVDLGVLNTQKLDFNGSIKRIGSGTITLTNKGLTYKGVKDGEEVETFFDAKNVYSLTISLAYELDLYYKNDYYNFKLTKDEKQITKWMVASEEIHNLYDDVWFNASKEVYDYES